MFPKKLNYKSLKKKSILFSKSKMPQLISKCDWCNASLSDTIVYELSTWVKNKHEVHTIGADCCMKAGRHADFANKHGCPRMIFEYRADPTNVSRLFASAELCHKRDPKGKMGGTRSAFSAAYHTYKQLSAKDRALVSK